MKGPVKSFNEFKSQLHESQANEGLRDMLSKAKDAVVSALKRVGEFFTGIGSAFMNALVNQSNGSTPEGVTIYPNDNDRRLLEKEGISISVKESFSETEVNLEDYPEKTEDTEDVEKVDEERISLSHQGDVDNVTTTEMTNQLRDLITALQEGTVKDPSKLNMLIWGAPGIGKTAIVKAVAKEFNFIQGNQRFIRVDLQAMEPTDFLLPYVNKDDKEFSAGDAKKVWLPMYDSFKHDEAEGNAIANGPDGKGGIMFFDEIARCKPAVKDVVMKLFDSDRGIGTWKLGDKWLLVAAANREGDQGDDDRTYHWNPILGNRFPVQVNFVPTFEEWEAWAGDIDPNTGDVRVMEDILAFLSYQKDKWFHNFDPDKLGLDGSKYVMFASPRTWEAASDLLKIGAYSAKQRKVKFDDDQMFRIVKRAVGKDAAEAFREYLLVKRRFNPETLKSIFTDPDKAPELWKETKDVQFAAVAAATFFTQDKKLSHDEVMNFTKYTGKFKDPVFAMYCMKALSRSHKELAGSDEWNDALGLFFDELYPSLSADDQVELKK
jgi:hypothetical protein